MRRCKSGRDRRPGYAPPHRDREAERAARCGCAQPPGADRRTVAGRGSPVRRATMAEPEKADAPAEGAAAGRAKASLPPNVANIRFLLVDGRTREMQFPTSTRIGTIKQELHKAWPDGAPTDDRPLLCGGSCAHARPRDARALGRVRRVGRRQGLDVAAGAAASARPLPGGHLHPGQYGARGDAVRRASNREPDPAPVGGAPPGRRRAGLRVPGGQTTVIHCVPRADGLPEKPGRPWAQEIGPMDALASLMRMFQPWRRATRAAQLTNPRRPPGKAAPTPVRATRRPPGRRRRAVV